MKKRSLIIAGHATSVSVEQAFWDELRLIAAGRGISLNQLVADIDAGRAGNNLSSAIRLFVLDALKKATAPGAGTPEAG
jgi:predicted DNA-binding ribbon-helix-helix protein